MAEEGAKVIICSRRQKNLTQALDSVKHLPIEGYICNVGSKEERQTLLKTIADKHGKLDVLFVNQAASTHFGN